MNHPVSTPAQLKAVLRSLRESQGLSQAALGERIGVSQRRIAAIEAAPGRDSFDQLSRMVAALGGRLLIDDQPGKSTTATAKKRARVGISERADW